MPKILMFYRRLITSLVQTIEHKQVHLDKTIMLNNHTLAVDFARFSLYQKVYYDSQLIGKKITVFGTSFSFSVNEDDEQANYEVQTRSRWHGLGYRVTIKRNNVTLFTD